jgi:hypothetical protein
MLSRLTARSSRAMPPRGPASRPAATWIQIADPASRVAGRACPEGRGPAGALRERYRILTKPGPAGSELLRSAR